MKDMLNVLGNAAAVFGLVICIVAGVWRVTGNYYLMGFQAVTIFSVGLSFLIVAILFKVETLLRQS